MKFYVCEIDATVYFFDGGWLRATPINKDGTFNTTESVGCYLNSEFTERNARNVFAHLGLPKDKVQMALDNLK